MLLQSFHKLRFVAFSLAACLFVTTSYAQEGLDGGSRSLDDGNSAQRVGSVFRDANGQLQVVIPLDALHGQVSGANGALSGESRKLISYPSMSRHAAAISAARAKAARARSSNSTGRVGTVQIHGGNVNLTPSQRAALQRIIQQRQQTQQKRPGAVQGLGFSIRGGDDDDDEDESIDEPTEIAGAFRTTNGLRDEAREHAYDPEGGDAEEDESIDEPTEIAGSFRTTNGLDANARSTANAGASNKPLGYVIRNASGKLMVVMPLESLRGVDASSALQGNSRDWLIDFIRDNQEPGTPKDGNGGGGGKRG